MLCVLWWSPFPIVFLQSLPGTLCKIFLALCWTQTFCCKSFLNQGTAQGELKVPSWMKSVLLHHAGERSLCFTSNKIDLSARTEQSCCLPDWLYPKGLVWPLILTWCIPCAGGLCNQTNSWSTVSLPGKRLSFDLGVPCTHRAQFLVSPEVWNKACDSAHLISRECWWSKMQRGAALVFASLSWAACFLPMFNV